MENQGIDSYLTELKRNIVVWGEHFLGGLCKHSLPPPRQCKYVEEAAQEAGKGSKQNL